MSFPLPFLTKLKAFQEDLVRLNVPVRPKQNQEKYAPTQAPEPAIENEFSDFEDDFEDDDEGFEEASSESKDGTLLVMSEDVLGMNISRVTSLINIRQIRGGEGQLEVVKL